MSEAIQIHFDLEYWAWASMWSSLNLKNKLNNLNSTIPLIVQFFPWIYILPYIDWFINELHIFLCKLKHVKLLHLLNIQNLPAENKAAYSRLILLIQITRALLRFTT